MDTILLFQHMDQYASLLRLEGITSVAKKAGWTVQVFGEKIGEQKLRDLKNFWHPIGTILSVNDSVDEFDARLFSPRDTVILDCFSKDALERFPSVITDSSAVTELAAKELLGGDCESYGFVPWPSFRLWSENRRQHLSRLLSEHGKTLVSFRPSRIHHDTHEFQSGLVPWLQSLPKPCGIMAANDHVGLDVVSACRVAGIQVPFECRVVGVDDNANLCDSSDPTLSSIRLDFRESGVRAAEMLRDLLEGRGANTIASIPPIGFARRNSSRLFMRTDRNVLKAAEYIRAKALGPLLPGEVLKLFPYSRRLAEMRFLEATGNTIQEEIISVRIAHAKHLLLNPFMRLDAVAAQCGYESDTTFRRIFKRETGFTLREWQKFRAS